MDGNEGVNKGIEARALRGLFTFGVTGLRYETRRLESDKSGRSKGSVTSMLELRDREGLEIVVWWVMWETSLLMLEGAGFNRRGRGSRCMR